MPATVWRIYWATWLFNLALIAVDLAWGAHAGLVARHDEIVRIVVRGLASLAVGALLLAISRLPRLRGTAREVFYRDAGAGILWIVTLAGFTCGALVFQYLSLTLVAPDVASSLVAADAWLGIHWPTIYQTVRAHAWLDAMLGAAYQSTWIQMACVPFLLVVTRNVRDYAEFVVQFMIGTVLVLMIATPFPAESAFVHFNVQDPGTASTVSDYLAFRIDHVRTLSFAAAQGLVSFPSFHTVMAMLFAYAMRHVRRLFPIFIVLNTLMVISTPSHGGHYVVDVVAGVAVGVLAVWISRMVFARTASSAEVSTLAVGQT